MRYVVRGEVDFEGRVLTGVAGCQIREGFQSIASNFEEMVVLSWCNSVFAGIIDQGWAIVL